MEPILAPPEPMQQSVRQRSHSHSPSSWFLFTILFLQFDSTESLELLNHARDWVEELSKKFPDRDYKATVSDINGRAVFIPRFLRPLPLPPAFAADGGDGGGGMDSQMQCVSIIEKKYDDEY